MPCPYKYGGRKAPAGKHARGWFAASTVFRSFCFFVAAPPDGVLPKVEDRFPLSVGDSI